MVRDRVARYTQRMGRDRQARRWRQALPPVVLLLGLALPIPAEASPSARLTYVRGKGAEKCPDEAMLRKEVAARLGFDVFFPWARRTVVAEITKGPRGFRARLQILSEDGVVLGVRAIDATSESCSDIAHALALAMSIAVDDFGLDDVPPPAPTEPPPQTPERPAPATAPEAPPSETSPRLPPPPPAEPPLRLSASLGTQVSFEVAPAASVGFLGAFDVRLARRLSIGIEARGDLPAEGEGVETYVIAGSVIPCLHYPSPLFVCAMVTAGDFHETGVGSRPVAMDALYLALGPRVGVEVPLGRRFFVLAHADAAFVLLRHRVDLNGNQVFELPLIAPSFGIGGGVLF